MSPAARRSACAAIATCPIWLSACSSAPPPAATDDPTVALVNGVPLKASSLLPTMLELAGTQALREHVLDQMLAPRRAGVTISEAMITRELAILRQEGPSVSPARLRQIAERNALLRALVAPNITITDAQIAQFHAIRHGPRARVSIIVLSDERAATALLPRLRDASDATFASIARAESIDASATRDGLLGAISPDDPALPLALRNAVSGAQTGATLGPILVPSGVAIVRVNEALAPSGKSFESFDSAERDAARADLRDRQESQAMELLAQRLIDQAAITSMDVRLRGFQPSANGRSTP